MPKVKSLTTAVVWTNKYRKTVYKRCEHNSRTYDSPFIINWDNKQKCRISMERIDNHSFYLSFRHSKMDGYWKLGLFNPMDIRTQKSRIWFPQQKKNSDWRDLRYIYKQIINTLQVNRPKLKVAYLTNIIDMLIWFWCFNRVLTLTRN